MSQPLRGRVHLSNPSLHIGKILLDDGRESRVMTFPDSFDNEDPILVSFKGDDPSGAVLQYEVQEMDWQYGYVKIYHSDRYFGNLTRSYPRLGELVFFHLEEYPAAHQKAESVNGDHVRYHLIKAQDGRVKAVDIEPCPREIEYLASDPFFGLLEARRVLQGRAGVVTRVIRGPKGNFGKIEPSDEGGLVHFWEDSFQNQFNRPPREGDMVWFEAQDRGKGSVVVRFFPNPEDGILHFVGRNAAVPCPRSAFANFPEPEEGTVYYAYLDWNERVRSIRKMDPKSFGEALACVKSDSLPLMWKTQAIQTLIDLNYHTPRLSSDELLNLRQRALAERVDYFLERDDRDRAIQFEALLQHFHPDAARLSALRPTDASLALDPTATAPTPEEIPFVGYTSIPFCFTEPDLEQGSLPLPPPLLLQVDIPLRETEQTETDPANGPWPLLLEIPAELPMIPDGQRFLPDEP